MLSATWLTSGYMRSGTRTRDELPLRTGTSIVHNGKRFEVIPPMTRFIRLPARPTTAGSEIRPDAGPNLPGHAETDRWQGPFLEPAGPQDPLGFELAECN